MPTWKELPPFEDVHSKALDSTFWGPKGTKQESRAMFNLLTPEVVLAAKEEIKAGLTVGLNWDLQMLGITQFGRLPFSHKIVPVQGYPSVLDDEYSMNPQSGSQWDGLRHWPDSHNTIFYGGQTLDEAKNPENHRMGVGAWAEAGIVGRGVLLDIAAYAEKNGIKLNPHTHTPISAQMVKDVAKAQGVTFKPGDILILRFGYTKAWEGFDMPTRKEVATGGKGAIGLEQSEEVLRFLWENHFAAVAGDTIALEAWPPANFEFCLHDHLLARWGMSIGEMWYLDLLAETCAKLGKYTFLVASAPFNQANAISSTPNAVAVL